ncbi:MAG: hypothetical protein JO061_11970 [Acidobacteriaceae bacterium]|nr:hypothetical protein [Acidobacteriaceae bacterium]
MAANFRRVESVEGLIEATADEGTREIIVTADLSEVPSVGLLPGQTLRSDSDSFPVLSFRGQTDGIRLSSDNTVADVDLITSPERRALWNDYSVPGLGTMSLRAVRTTGRVQILARDKVRSGHIEVDGLDIRVADARGEIERPRGYGVYVLHGAFTLWNMQPDENAVLTADLVNLSAGRFGSPVLGSGVFVSGAGDQGGRIDVQRLETGAVYIDGKIAPGTADEIAGGVFVVYGAHVDTVINRGPVFTYGPNDMALDNWGTVDRWLIKEKVTTRGPSGIGFINFGSIRDLRVESPIETWGQGARGFNVYSGTIERAEFDRLVTHADGAVGIQISRPIGTLVVRRGIETFGGTGPSLVKGVVQTFSAIGLSIKTGGSARSVSIDGGVITHGESILPLELAGSVDTCGSSEGFPVTGVKERFHDRLRHLVRWHAASSQFADPG